MSSANGEGIGNGGNEQTPVARLCHIVKWKHFDGYGFNLHAEKGKPGQIIGKVDEGSPAEAAGLKEGDRIVEVNGVNIANENHKQVVQRIKAVEDETKLLVVDAEADKYFKSKNIVIKSSLPEVVHLQTPPSPAVNGKNRDRQSDSHDTPDAPSTPGHSTPSSDRKGSLQSEESSPEPDQAENENGSLERKNNTLNLNMTAAELRAQLASRKIKKIEVKKETIDFKQKYEIIQKL